MSDDSADARPTVTLSLTVYSSTAGQAGSWTIERRVRLPRVPVAGDQVCWHDGWANESVKTVVLPVDGPAHVELHPISTDSPDRLAELACMVDEHGWMQLGGPWKGQTP